MEKGEILDSIKEQLFEVLEVQERPENVKRIGDLFKKSRYKKVKSHQSNLTNSTLRHYIINLSQMKGEGSHDCKRNETTNRCALTIYNLLDY